MDGRLILYFLGTVTLSSCFPYNGASLQHLPLPNPSKGTPREEQLFGTPDRAPDSPEIEKIHPLWVMEADGRNEVENPRWRGGRQDPVHLSSLLHIWRSDGGDNEVDLLRRLHYPHYMPQLDAHAPDNGDNGAGVDTTTTTVTSAEQVSSPRLKYATCSASPACHWFTSWQAGLVMSLAAAWVVFLAVLFYLSRTSCGQSIVENLTCQDSMDSGEEQVMAKGIGYFDGSPGMRRSIYSPDVTKEGCDSEAVLNEGAARLRWSFCSEATNPGSSFTDGAAETGGAFGDGAERAGPSSTDGTTKYGGALEHGTAEMAVVYYTDGTAEIGSFVVGSAERGPFLDGGAKAIGPFVDGTAITGGPFVDLTVKTRVTFADETTKTRDPSVGGTTRPGAVQNDGTARTRYLTDSAPKKGIEVVDSSTSAPSGESIKSLGSWRRRQSASYELKDKVNEDSELEGGTYKRQEDGMEYVLEGMVYMLKALGVQDEGEGPGQDGEGDWTGTVSFPLDHNDLYDLTRKLPLIEEETASVQTLEREKDSHK